MRLLVFGHQEMVGHAVALCLKEYGHTVDCYYGCLHDETQIRNSISGGGYDAVINCTAIINQFAENDKNEAEYVNSYFPHLLERLTDGMKTVVVHRSTDCIFSGKKGGYDLTDIPDADSFYAKTKAAGELVNGKDITIRTSLIGPETEESGIGLLNWFLKQHGEIKGFANAMWTGLTTMEFARVIEHLLKHNAYGLFQIVPNHNISKYDLLQLFAKYFPGDRVVKKYENELVDKSLIQRVGDYGLVIPDYEQQVAEMAGWIDRHQSLYPDYYNVYK